MDEKDFLIDNKLISKALFIRKFEERLFDLFNKGKIFGTIHTCIGQELIPVCLAEFSTEDDFWLSNHRGHGHYLAKGGDVNLLMAEIMGKSSGCSGGIGGSQHLFSTNFLSNGIQGGMTPLGIGIGFSFKLRNKNSIVIAFIGDGTLGQGILYEAFNLAGSWNIPILFVLENNGYAQSTSFQQTFAGDIKYRSQGFGLNYFNTNNYDLSSLLNTSQTAISYVRNSKKPALLEIKTYRLKAHSKGDDNRKSEEIKKYEELDLLNRMINKIDLDIEKINLLIDSAVEFSENSNETIVFNSNSSILSASTNYVDLIISYGRVNNNIYEALKEGFQNHENLICIGEDIENITSWTEKPYGGAFNVSQDLSAIYKGRVLNTPISEGGIIGVGIGLALTGFLPIVEIMFGDFITLIFDQLVQHASKINQMYGRKIKIPLIIRTPMGGKRGYGPTHSQSLEKYLLGVPNISIIALNQRISVKNLYKELFLSIEQTTIVIENKVLYTRFQEENMIKGFTYLQTDERIPSLVISPPNNDAVITIVCYGGILEEAEKAARILFEKEEILVEIICLTSLQPLNIEPIIKSVLKTEALIIVEEGSNIGSIQSIISAQLLEKSIKISKYRSIGYNGIIPASFNHEKNVLVNSEIIFKEIMDLVNGE